MNFLLPLIINVGMHEKSVCVGVVLVNTNVKRTKELLSE
jgi:hypothetical protein